MKNSIIFCSIWILYLFLYLIYWKFDINGIFKNYSIDDVSNTSNILYVIILFFIVTNMNAVCLFSIKDEIKSKPSDNKVYIIDN